MTRRLGRLAGSAAAMFLALAAMPAPALAGRLAVLLTDAAGLPLPEAVVVARPVGTAAGARPARSGEMVQQGQSFAPAVMVVTAGTEVAFPNKDRMRHHIYSFSEAKRFEVRLYSGEAVPTLVFDRPGVITLGCNIHDWMRGFIYVADSPYFAISNPEGQASLGELPDGPYELVLWHHSLGEASVVRPGVLKVAGDVRIAEMLPATAALVAQVPGDDDPLTAKFRRRDR